jgi:hypothetical protein
VQAASQLVRVPNRWEVMDNRALLGVCTVTVTGKATLITFHVNRYRGGKLLVYFGCTSAR